MMNLSKDKLREEMIGIMRDVPVQERERTAINQIIIEFFKEISGDKILIYKSFKNEIDISTASEFLQKSNHLFFPATKKLCIYSLMDPKEEITEFDELNFVIVPGIAFDRTGARLGRGGGWYDRILRETNAFRIGICREFQLVEKVPEETHDQKMDCIITESNILKF